MASFSLLICQIGQHHDQKEKCTQLLSLVLQKLIEPFKYNIEWIRKEEKDLNL